MSRQPESIALKAKDEQSADSDSYRRGDGENELVKRSRGRAASNGNGTAKGDDDEDTKTSTSQRCCTPRNMQSLLLIVLLLALVCAIFLFVVGWLAIDKLTYYIPFLPSAPQRVSLHALLVLGVGGLVVNVYCFVAIFIKHTAPNYVAAVLLGVLVLLQLLLALFLLVSSFTLAGPLHTSLEYSMRHQYFHENNTNNSARIQLIDILQIEQDCCGAASFHDWADSVWFRGANNGSDTRNYSVPPSCCISPQFNCGYNTNVNNIKYGGCVTPLLKLWRPELRFLSLVTALLISPDAGALLLFVFLLLALRRAAQAEEENEEKATDGKQPPVRGFTRVPQESYE